MSPKELHEYGKAVRLGDYSFLGERMSENNVETEFGNNKSRWGHLFQARTLKGEVLHSTRGLYDREGEYRNEINTAEDYMHTPVEKPSYLGAQISPLSSDQRFAGEGKDLLFLHRMLESSLPLLILAGPRWHKNTGPEVHPTYHLMYPNSIGEESETEGSRFDGSRRHILTNFEGQFFGKMNLTGKWVTSRVLNFVLGDPQYRFKGSSYFVALCPALKAIPSEKDLAKHSAVLVGGYYLHRFMSAKETRENRISLLKAKDMEKIAQVKTLSHKKIFTLLALRGRSSAG